MKNYDFIIIGGGIVGMTLAHELRRRSKKASLVVIEKEDEVGRHASGRNSGVLHAGFYYSAESLKARFTAEGNREMKAFCKKAGVPVNPCRKVVVARDEEELETLRELERRGRINGVEVKLIGEKELARLDPNARTHGLALYSPSTATVDPERVCLALKQKLMDLGVEFRFSEGYRSHGEAAVITGRDRLRAGHIVNCAGLYADRIAKDFGFGRDYTIIPFKGIYLKYTGERKPVRTNLYPVPHKKNPFLGVHFTVMVDGGIKIGPTAIPAFWRENYGGLSRFRPGEFLEIAMQEARLFIANSFGFRDLAFDEMKKYSKKHFIDLARSMVGELDGNGFTEWSRPGIRAQLLNKKTRELVQDFVVEGDGRSTHVLNAVSPAFTASFPFSRHVADIIVSSGNRGSGA